MGATYWEAAFDYLMSLGIPEPVLRMTCIPSEDADQLINLLQERAPRKILEIGTFVGLSTSVLLQASASSTQLVCVDPDLPVTVQSGAFGHVENRGAYTFLRQVLEHFRKAERTVLLAGFFSSVSRGDRAQLEHLGIDPDSVGIIGARALDLGPFDMVLVDGDHFADSVYEDLSALHGHLAPNALVVLHDLTGGWQTEVQAGVRRFLGDHPEYAFTVRDNLGLLAAPPLL